VRSRRDADDAGEVDVRVGLGSSRRRKYPYTTRDGVLYDEEVLHLLDEVRRGTNPRDVFPEWGPLDLRRRLVLSILSRRGLIEYRSRRWRAR